MTGKNINNPFNTEADKTRQQKEYRLQCHIVKMHEIYFSHVMMTAFPGRPGDAKDGFFKQQMGVAAGASDIFLYWVTDKLDALPKPHPLCAGMMEIKVDSGLSGPQNKWLSRFHAYGGYTGVSHSWREYYEGLCNWRIRPKSIPLSFIEPDYRTEQQKYSDSFEMFRP